MLVADFEYKGRFSSVISLLAVNWLLDVEYFKSDFEIAPLFLFGDR